MAKRTITLELEERFFEYLEEHAPAWGFDTPQEYIQTMAIWTFFINLEEDHDIGATH